MSVFDHMAWAKRQQTGSVGRKAVLMALAERTGDRPVCFPSQRLLAEETEQGERTVRRHLADLEDLGLITSSRSYVDSDGEPLTRGKACNKYRLHVDQPARSAGGPDPDQPADKTRPTGRSEPTNRPTEPDQPAAATAAEVPYVEEPLEPPSQNTLTLVGSPPADLFEEFWSVYPKHVEKKATRDAWAKALKKAPAQTIVDGAARYAAERRGSPYVKDPHRWLNGERWNDEPGANRDQFGPTTIVRRGALAAGLDEGRDLPSGRVDPSEL